MPAKTCVSTGSSGITWGFPQLSPTSGYVRNALLARPPLYSGLPPFAFDLHALAMPPAFTLSQDQTLQLIFVNLSENRIDLLRESDRLPYSEEQENWSNPFRCRRGC